MNRTASDQPPTFEEVRAFLSGHAPLPSSSREDGWLTAASILRDAARSVPGVIGLVESAAFQTRGRGPAIHGVALSLCLGGGASAEVGVILDEAVVGTRPRLDQTLAEVEARSSEAWAALETGIPLRLTVHLVAVGEAN